MRIIAEHETKRTFKTRSPNPRYRQGRFPALLVVVVLVLFVVWGGFHFAHPASKFARLDLASKMEEATAIYDRNGKLMYQLYKKRRTVVPLSRISQNMLHAILATEDRNFYKHSGYDSIAILRAVWVNLKAGRVIQGGSTLTQQLAKNTFLTSQRSFRRKIQEFWLAQEIEKHYSKDKILELYANCIYLGSGFYGVEAASRGYFGKSAAELNPGEAAMLAGIARAPNTYSPHISLSQARKRQQRSSAVTL